MRALLHLKAWQLFLLVVGVPLVLQMVVMGSLFSRHAGRWVLPGILLASLLSLGALLAWFVALNVHLHRRLPAAAPMNLTRLRLAAAVPVAYLLLLVVGVATASGGGPSGGAVALLVLLHLASMACVFYCLYFTAKALKTVERQAPVSFGEYVGEFFLLWFFPVGIWLLQPRVNRLFAPSSERPPEFP
ncbi:hypothetical protein JAO73_07625 [Hymenobacter sp. BT523]|uniref:hypothetical protein n=1 Tax=Hymenobacter sp. BT523 TaxID=2795725 RepID=UPI0018ECFC13|nr:hypothetical protein [Hymenobacter sp. BT523]MBJ6108872.1 hypothetical protein [Hymenobacter sp. BT523]